MKMTTLDIVYRVSGDTKIVSSIFSSLTPEQQERFAILFSDFEEMWKSEDDVSIKFVIDLFTEELGLGTDTVTTLLKDYQKQSHSISIKEEVVTEVVSRKTHRPDVRKDLLDNLIKVRFARERKILYGEIIDMRDLDVESIKLTHPRIYMAAVQDAESLMKGIDPVDNLLFINDVSTGLVRDIVDILREHDSLSVTNIVRLMKRRYSTWSQKVRNTLEWLVQQGLVSRVGLSRYTLRVEDSYAYQLSSLEQRILSHLDNRHGKNKSQLYRNLGVINHIELRGEVNFAIQHLEDKGYIFKGAYNRLLKTIPQEVVSS